MRLLFRPNRTFFLLFGGISSEFGRLTVRISLKPTKPDMLPKDTIENGTIRY